MYRKRGCCRAAAVLLLCSLTFGLLATASATAEEAVREDMRGDGIDLDPADLAAVAGPTRRLMTALTDHIKLMSTEMGVLRTDKAALAERVMRLEELDCSERRREEKIIEAKEETKMPQKPAAYTAARNLTRHRRVQASSACERVHDFQALTSAAMDACCPQSGGGHRRMQASCDLPVTCPSAACAAVFVPYIQDCATMIAATPGVPVADFQSFAASCAEMQAGAGEMLQPVAVQMFRVLVNTEGAAQAGTMFPGGGDGDDGSPDHPLDPLQPLAPVPPPPPDATEGADEAAGVTQYHRVCTSADIASCVPACNAEHHGYELLATIDGTDTKFSCNLAHGLFSWMGAAAEGGYLGADSASFFSAVVSGAAGAYLLMLTADAGISTDLTIHPGQDVRLNGAVGLSQLPSWGSGGFMVQEMGSLSLLGLYVVGRIAVQSGGRVSITGSDVGDDVNVAAAGVLELSQVTWQGQTVSTSSSTETGSMQCFAPYTTVSDAWRATSYTADRSHGDCAVGTPGWGNTQQTGVGGGRWYRFEGAGGDALPLTSPGGIGKCGTSYSGWLSGWEHVGRVDTAPLTPYRGPNSVGPGRYPAADEGVVEMTACFDGGGGCDDHAAVGVLHCEGFLLWRLPYGRGAAGGAQGDCGYGYCTAPSGL
jgi:hypothetical protein